MAKKAISARMLRTAAFAVVRGAAYTAGGLGVTALAWWLQNL
jgi:hypothetical protein